MSCGLWRRKKQHKLWTWREVWFSWPNLSIHLSHPYKRKYYIYIKIFLRKCQTVNRIGSPSEPGTVALACPWNLEHRPLISSSSSSFFFFISFPPFSFAALKNLLLYACILFFFSLQMTNHHEEVDTVHHGYLTLQWTIRAINYNFNIWWLFKKKII